MAINTRTFALISAIGGGCVGIPLYLWQTNGLGVSSKSSTQKPFSSISSSVTNAVPKQTRRITTPRTGRENCDVMKLSSDLEDFLKGQGEKKESYIELSCDKNEISSGISSFPHNWTGLFPNHVLSESDLLQEGDKLEVKTETTESPSGQESQGNNRKTIFSGNGMKTPTGGAWGNELQSKRGSVTPVLITDTADKPNKIYFLSD